MLPGGSSVVPKPPLADRGWVQRYFGCVFGGPALYVEPRHSPAASSSLQHARSAGVEEEEWSAAPRGLGSPRHGKEDAADDAAPPGCRSGLGQCKGVFPVEKMVGMLLGLVLFYVFLNVELSDKFPKANDMLAILALVGCLWVFEVLPLPVTSLLPMGLLPFAEIMTSKAVSKSYWNWVQMLFVGAFMVDIAIQQVNLHRRVALFFLLKVGVKHPWVVLLTFSLISYCMSMWCTNTATAVMLTPFAKALLDTAESSGAARASPESRDEMRRYSVGVLIGIAYSATCGGIATSIGTPPNGVLAGMPEVNGMVSAQDWLMFAFPVSAIGFVLAIGVVYALFVRGVSLEMDRNVLLDQYAALGPLNRDEVVVATVQLLQIAGWLSRKDLINSPSSGLGIKGVDDATIACMAAIVLFFIPSSKRPGETVLTWDVAQAHLPWGVLLLMGGAFAIADGFKESKLTRFVGEKLAECVHMDRLVLTYLMVLVVNFLTEVTSNTATANIMLPILASVAVETLTHPLALMLPATVACSFAFMLPAATPPNSVVFGTKRVAIRDFVKAGVIINLILVLVGSPLLYLMGTVVYDTAGPFPQWACLPESCRWVDVPGLVAGGREVASQACVLLAGGACRLFNGTVLGGAP